MGTNDKTFAMNLQAKVRQLRAGENTTQDKFAVSLGLPWMAVSKLERAEIKQIPLVTLEAILTFARSKGISSDEFLFNIHPVLQTLPDHDWLAELLKHLGFVRLPH